MIFSGTSKTSASPPALSLLARPQPRRRVHAVLRHHTFISDDQISSTRTRSRVLTARRRYSIATPQLEPDVDPISVKRLGQAAPFGPALLEGHLHASRRALRHPPRVDNLRSRSGGPRNVTRAQGNILYRLEILYRANNAICENSSMRLKTGLARLGYRYVVPQHCMLPTGNYFP